MQTGGGEERAPADMQEAAWGTSLTSAGWLQGGAGKKPGDTGRRSGCWLPGDAKHKNLASTGRVRGCPAGL